MKDVKSKSYLILSVIESTPSTSLQAAEDEMNTLFDTPANKTKTELLKGIQRTCQSNEDVVYHGWLNVSSKAAFKGKAPSSARSFVSNDSLSVTKTKRYVLAALPKSSLNAFKELMVHTLSLDTQMGGFHDTPKFVPSLEAIETQTEPKKAKGSGIVQDTPQISSTKTIAKSTNKQSHVAIMEDLDDDWADEDDVEASRLDLEDDNMIVHEVEDINHKLKERADKQQNRAIHLNKWEMSLTQRESAVHKLDQEMSARETNVTQQKVANEDKLCWHIFHHLSLIQNLSHANYTEKRSYYQLLII